MPSRRNVAMQDLTPIIFVLIIEIKIVIIRVLVFSTTWTNKNHGQIYRLVGRGVCGAGGGAGGCAGSVCLEYCGGSCGAVFGATTGAGPKAGRGLARGINDNFAPATG